MSDVGKREARAFTAVFLVFAVLAVVSSVSPALEATLNLWIGVPVVVAGGVALIVLLVRTVWSWLVDGRGRRKRGGR